MNVLDKYKDSTYKLDFNTFTTNININGNIYEYSLFGDYQYKNFLCAYEVVKYLGIDENIIKEAAPKIKKDIFEVETDDLESSLM